MKAWDAVDHLLALDPGGRGIAGFFTPGAALDAAHALQRGRRVLITTGFTVAENSPESDGPPGAAVLGRALRRLGARVRYISDPVNVPLLEAVLKTLDEPPDIAIFPEGADAADLVLRRERPSHMIAIERPGRGRDGDYLNVRGVSVAAWNRPLDALFLEAERSLGSRRGRPGRVARGSAAGVTRGRPARRSRSPIVTIGVGDGGNEIGMGNVRARLARQGSLMARVASVVSTDHLVVAGTSNWGAYGIVAQLSRLSGEPLLHTADVERRLIAACVEAGAIDGISRRREVTVDGLTLDTLAAFVELLRQAAAAGMMRRPPKGATP